MMESRKSSSEQNKMDMHLVAVSARRWVHSKHLGLMLDRSQRGNVSGRYAGRVRGSVGRFSQIPEVGLVIVMVLVDYHHATEVWRP